MKLSYPTAKKLQDAGFPQEGEGIFCGNVGMVKPEDFTPGGVIGIAQEDFVYMPTLSELIEAFCELTLMVGDDKTVALNAKNPMESTARGEGPTPEEAVAALYCAIHTPKSG